jgi:hypothetical protein
VAVKLNFEWTDDHLMAVREVIDVCRNAYADGM